MNEIEVVKSVPIEAIPISKPLAVQERVEVKPWYIWKGRDTYYPSRLEMCIAEEFVRSKSFVSCVSAVKERCGKVISVGGVQGILKRDHVGEWCRQRMEELGLLEGWTEGRWLKLMTDHLEGVKRLRGGDLLAMGLIAKHRGWGAGKGVQIVNSINFTERD